MKAIIRKTWEMVNVVGIPTGANNEYKLVTQPDGREFSEEEVLSVGNYNKKYEGLYAAKNRNGSVVIFTEKPVKSELLGVWKGKKLFTIEKPFTDDYILSWNNCEPTPCGLDLSLKTELYRSHHKSHDTV